MPILYSLQEAATALGGISHWTLRKHASAGRIKVIHLGRRVFVDAEELERIRREGLPSLRAETGKNASFESNQDQTKEDRSHV
jgi:hypothetical protein